MSLGGEVVSPPLPSAFARVIHLRNSIFWEVEQDAATQRLAAGRAGVADVGLAGDIIRSPYRLQCG